MTAKLYIQCLFGIFSFMVAIIAGEAMFSVNYTRRKPFGRRTALMLLSSVALVAVMSALYALAASTNIPAVLFVINNVIYFALFAFTFFAMKFCYSERIPALITCGIAAYASQHVAFCIANILQHTTGMYETAFESMTGFFLLNLMHDGVIVAAYVVIYFVFARKANRFAPEDAGRGVLTLSVAMLVVVLVLNAFRELFAAESTGLFVVDNLFSIACCMFILIIRTRMLEVGSLRREVDVINRLRYDEQKQFGMTKENIEIINVKCHDIRRQLEVFGAQGKTMTESELSELTKAVNIYDSMLKTGNETLDVILGERGLFCEKHGIRLTCNVDGEKLGFMSAADISSLFGNAVDNAIEAVMAIEDKNKRVISLVVCEKIGNLSVLMRNYYERDVVFEGGLPVTVKPDKTYHGFGAKSMRMIVEKYGGTISFDTANGIFYLMAMFPL